MLSFHIANAANQFAKWFATSCSEAFFLSLAAPVSG